MRLSLARPRDPNDERNDGNLPRVGLILFLFTICPPGGLYITDDGLTAFVNVNVSEPTLK